MPRRGKKGEILESPTFKKVYSLRERPSTSLYTCDLERSQEIENFITGEKSPDEIKKLSASLRKKAVVKENSTPTRKTSYASRRPKRTPKAVTELNAEMEKIEIETPTREKSSNASTTRKRTRKAAETTKRNLQNSFAAVDSTGDRTVSSRSKKAPVRRNNSKSAEKIHAEQKTISPVKHRKFQKNI